MSNSQPTKIIRDKKNSTKKNGKGKKKKRDHHNRGDKTHLEGLTTLHTPFICWGLHGTRHSFFYLNYIFYILKDLIILDPTWKLQKKKS